jgi:RNA polymerase sigma factor (sigma-70 family)
MPAETNKLNIDQVVIEYKYLVQSIAAHYKNHGLSLDDLTQEGMLGLLEACQRFDAKHNTQFSTYATFWIKKYILLAISREQKHTNNTSNIEVAELQDQSMPEKSLTLKPDNSISKLILSSDLPPIEKQILILSYREGKTIKEITSILNLSSEKVKQYRSMGLRRIKKNNPQSV